MSALGMPASAAAAAPPDRAGQELGPSARDLNWLRAAVLGANDGIVSIAATVVGVAAATSSVTTIAIAGFAALAAGAMSMAAGEYVSVSSQRDAERATHQRSGAGHEIELTNPWHAALASFLAFSVGGIVPMLVILAPWGSARTAATFAAVVLALVATGVLSARIGRAPVTRAALRTALWGSLAMAVTYGVGLVIGELGIPGVG